MVLALAILSPTTESASPCAVSPRKKKKKKKKKKIVSSLLCFDSTSQTVIASASLELRYSWTARGLTDGVHIAELNRRVSYLEQRNTSVEGDPRHHPLEAG